jgi:hypothetical protein
MQNHFLQFKLNYPENLFTQLSESADFENITKDRLGANLVDYQNGLIPIVRTTTSYHKSNQKFLPIHCDIIESIKKASNINDLNFNNAMIEIYSLKYRTMNFHTDQSLDLEDNSYICIFSCYDKIPDFTRKLVIKNKLTNELSEVSLEHNSIVLFSTKTNKQFVHKIILDQFKLDNRWLGITFRLSKTFIKFINEIPYFCSNNKTLKLVNKDQLIEFRKYKHDENLQIDFSYPEIDYTISVGDLIPI